MAEKLQLFCQLFYLHYVLLLKEIQPKIDFIEETRTTSGNRRGALNISSPFSLFAKTITPFDYVPICDVTTGMSLLNFFAD